MGGLRCQALEQRLQGIEAFFRSFHGHLEAEQGCAFELVAVRLALDQLDQYQRVDLGIGGEFYTTALRSGIDLEDSKFFRLQLQKGQAHQVLRRIGQEPEAVDHLHLQLAQTFLVRGVGDALVEDQPGMHVGQVILGDQRRHPQVDLRPTAQRLLEVRLLALADGLHCPFEHFHVEGEADRLDLPALAVAEQLAGAADLQVVGGEDEAGAQVLGVGDGFQAFLGVRGHLSARRCQQVGVGLVVAATDAAAQLVQLGQAELVGALDEDGVGAGHVDAGLDDGRGHQHVEALVVEVAHHLFQLALVHLSVTDADARLRDQFGEVAGALLDGLHFVVQVVHLAAAQQFAEQRFL